MNKTNLYGFLRLGEMICYRLGWRSNKPRADEYGQWYPVSREPCEDECLRFNPATQVIEPEHDSNWDHDHEPLSELELLRNKIKQQLRNELVDIILQNKDNPAALAEALCARAKEIETENHEEEQKK